MDRRVDCEDDSEGKDSDSEPNSHLVCIGIYKGWRNYHGHCHDERWDTIDQTPEDFSQLVGWAFKGDVSSCDLNDTTDQVFGNLRLPQRTGNKLWSEGLNLAVQDDVSSKDSADDDSFQTKATATATRIDILAVSR